MPTSEDLAKWGAYELSFEELLEVNGGKRDRSGGSSGGGRSSGSGGSSSKGSSGRGSNKSSGGGTKSKETNKEKSKGSKTHTGSTGREGKKNGVGGTTGNGLKGGEPKSKEEKKSGSTDYTVREGDTLSGIVRERYPGASKEEIAEKVREVAKNSGIKDINVIHPGDKIVFEKPTETSSGEGKASAGGTSREGRVSTGSGFLRGGGYQQGAGKSTIGEQGQGNGLPQKPNPAVPALSEEKKGLREKISGWFNGRKEDVVGMWDWGKRKLDSIGQGIVAGMNSQLRMFSELTGIRMVQNGKKDGAGEWRNGLAGQENIKSVSSDGTWGNNGDATFTARKGATLSGLQRLTGKDWRESNWDKTRDPRTLQVGETVDMGKRTVKPEDAITVSNTVEARKLYFGGNKSPVWLSDEIFRAVQSGTVTTYKINERIKTGATELAKGDWGEDLTDIENMWFVGKTNIDYKIYTGTDITIVDMSAFVRDGCWDIFGEEGDATGPKKEFPFGSPYPFIERSWSISFPNPEKINWR
jgi:lysM domain protein